MKPPTVSRLGFLICFVRNSSRSVPPCLHMSASLPPRLGEESHNGALGGESYREILACPVVPILGTMVGL